MEDFLQNERERLPLLIPVGLGLGIAIWEIGWNAAFPWLLGLCLLLSIIGYMSQKGSYSRLLLWSAAICILAGYGSISFKSAQLSSDVLDRPWIGKFYGRIVKVEDLAARQKKRLTLVTDRHQSLPNVVRVNLSPDQYRQEFRAGAVILLRARLMPPAPPLLPGGYDFARRAWFSAIGASGSALGPVELHAAALSHGGLDNIRQQLSTHVRSRLSPDTGSIAAALATGDTGAISQDDATAMRESGMAHLLSISGLHVTAIVGGVFLFISRILALWPWFALRYRVPIFAASISALAAVGYTLLTGAEVPTIRSCIAALLILVALVMGREVLSLRMVAAGAVFVMLLWPETLAGPSFQLSFAAVTSIIVLHETKWMTAFRSRAYAPLWEKAARGIISLLLTGLLIEIVLSPIALFHFHKTGIYGALANLIAIPLTTFVIMPMEALALLADVIGAGAPFWWIVEQGLSAILAIAHYTSDLPGAVTMRPEMPLWAFGAIMSGGLWLAIFRSHARLLGLFPSVIGVTGLVLAPRPDILISADGKHLAIVDDAQNIALLRARAGDYVRDTMREAAGIKIEPIALADFEGAKCSVDACIVTLEKAGRPLRVMAIRTSNLIPAMQLAAACKRVDIVVSERYLPRSCTPRWLKLDRRILSQTGGTAIYIGEKGKGRIDTVQSRLAGAPWFMLKSD